MYAIKYLEIQGFRNGPVPNTFFQQEAATDRLAIVMEKVVRAIRAFGTS